MKPIPDNIKEILGQLAGPQQVALRTYIASLRSEIKDLEAEVLAKTDPDPHAHYHGHEKCTADHSHENDHHGEEKGHSHEHDHHKEQGGHAHDHDHKMEEDHHEHRHHHHQEDHHEHHHDHETCKEDHDHHHEHEKHEGHDHGHKHGHDKAEEMPAWKKKALKSGAGSDPMAAPFGGDWKTEASLSASKDKMEE